jgi:hypothetical protein
LVTFIACEFVTAARITEILGCHPARFRRSLRKPKRAASPKNLALLPCGIGYRGHAFDCMSGFPD